METNTESESQPTVHPTMETNVETSVETKETTNNESTIPTVDRKVEDSTPDNEDPENNKDTLRTEPNESTVESQEPLQIAQSTTSKPLDVENDNEDNAGSSGKESSENEEGDDSDDTDDTDDTDNGLSDYEKLRLERIKRNQQYLSSLGLAGQGDKEGAVSGILGAPAPKKRRRRKPTEDAPVNLRTSLGRASKDKVNYNPAELDFRYMGAKSKTGRPRGRPPTGNAARLSQRVPKVVYSEFARLKKRRKQFLKSTKKWCRDAQRELGYYQLQHQRAQFQHQREVQLADIQKRQAQERIELNGRTKLEWLQEIDARSHGLWAATVQHEQQQQRFAQEIKQRQLQKADAKRQEELEQKMEMIDALDRFPKAYKEATRILNSSLLHRSPKDPPPPRRSKRKSDEMQQPEPTKPKKRGRAPKKQERTDDPPNQSAAASNWTNVLAETMEETNEPKNDAEPSDEENDNSQRRKKKEPTGRVVGGWISPPFANEIDRSWLERERPLRQVDLESYTPQVGDTVLYYPGAHKKFLQIFPDELGNKTRNQLRLPLWQRAKREQGRAKRNIKNGSAKDDDADSWWTEEWLNGIDSKLGSYPLLCRVERTHAEFPPDPYGSNQVVEADGTVSWVIPKNKNVKKRGTTNMRWAVLLKPLSPVLPPEWDEDGNVVRENDRAVPANFTVVTFPCRAQPFLVPFAWAYCLAHTVDLDDAVKLRSSDRSKGRIGEFVTLDDKVNYGNFRLDDKLDRIRQVVNGLQRMSASHAKSALSLPLQDASFVLELWSRFVQEPDMTLSSNTEPSTTSLQQTLFDLIRSTLPLFKGIGVRRDVFHRQTLYVSRWDLTARKKNGDDEIENDNSTLANLLKQGMRHDLENALRIKMVCAIQDTLDTKPEAADFVPLVTEDVAPSYFCAVPIGMHFDRILARLECDPKTQQCYYTSVESVLSDLQAISENCLLYNSPESPLVAACTSIIPALKKRLADLHTKHLRERSNRIKSELELTRLGDDSGVPTKGDTPGKRKKGSSGVIPDSLNTPYRGELQREWLSTLRPDETCVGNNRSEADSTSCSWIPQRGDVVLYSKSRHEEFVKGHDPALSEEHCVVPSWDPPKVPPTADSASLPKSIEGSPTELPGSQENESVEATDAGPAEDKGKEVVSTQEALVEQEGASEAIPDGEKEPCTSNHRDAVEMDTAPAAEHEATGPASSVGEPDSSSDVVDKGWMKATIVGVRATFPLESGANEDGAFDSETPILIITLKPVSPCAEATSKETHVVCWRPCSLSSDDTDCPTCGLSKLSFLRPAWIPKDTVASNNNSGTKNIDVAPPNGMDADTASSIGRCFDILKKRCLTDIAPDYVDPKLCLENAQSGSLSVTAASGTRNLPSFEYMMTSTLSKNEPSKSVGTRGIRRTEDDTAIRQLSGLHFLPPWSKDELESGTRGKKQSSMEYLSTMPVPTLCFELICLRLKNGYYRQAAAIAHDLEEAYVTTTFFLLAGPASRKKNRLSIRKLAKHLASAKGNERVANIVRPKQLKKKMKKQGDINLSEVAVSKPNKGNHVKKESDTTTQDSLEGFNEEERDLLNRIDIVRKLYSMAILSVTDCYHMGHIFGLAPRKPPKSAQSQYANIPELVVTAEEMSGVAARTEACNRIKYLLTAVGRDPCLNRFNVAMGMKIKFTVGGQSVSRDKEDGPDGVGLTATELTFRRYANPEIGKNDSLARCLFRRTARRAPCARCQVFGIPFFMCRVQRCHSNPDFDFVENLKHFRGVDGLLRPLLQTKQPAPPTPERMGLTLSPTNDAKANNAHAASDMAGGKESSNQTTSPAAAEESTVVARTNLEEATQNLTKAETANTTAGFLFRQMQLISALPIRLGEKFIEAVYPVDPEDGHYTWCIICGLSGNVLCCDGCSNVVHPKCVGLLEIPDDDWFCSKCGPKKGSTEKGAEPSEGSTATQPPLPAVSPKGNPVSDDKKESPIPTKDGQQEAGLESASAPSSRDAPTENQAVTVHDKVPAAQTLPEITEDEFEEKAEGLEELLGDLLRNRMPKQPAVATITNQPEKDDVNVAVQLPQTPSNKSVDETADTAMDKTADKVVETADAVMDKTADKAEVEQGGAVREESATNDTQIDAIPEKRRRSQPVRFAAIPKFDEESNENHRNPSSLQSIPGKRRPGRPRKNPQVEGQIRKRGRPRKSEATTLDPDNVVPIKRRRGRPAKNTVVLFDNVEEVTTPKRCPGRPRKDKSDNYNDVPTAAKPQRGRPRMKTPSLTDGTRTKLDQDGIEAEGAGKRWVSARRTRKATYAADSETTDVDSSNTKGAPSGSRPISNEQTTSKKRGRPGAARSSSPGSIQEPKRRKGRKASPPGIPKNSTSKSRRGLLTEDDGGNSNTKNILAEVMKLADEGESIGLRRSRRRH